jgi:hypothetical protein
VSGARGSEWNSLLDDLLNDELDGVEVIVVGLGPFLEVAKVVTGFVVLAYQLGSLETPILCMGK